MIYFLKAIYTLTGTIKQFISDESNLYNRYNHY